MKPGIVKWRPLAFLADRLPSAGHPLLPAILGLLCLSIALPVAANDSVKTLFQKNCASCHGPKRLGGMGPALLPENLVRLRPKAAVDVITHGRPDTQMQGFGKKLTAAQIKSLADYIFTPLPEVPHWGLAEINASHVIYHPPGSLPDRPVFKVKDLENLFIVVELGDHHATLLDGDTFKPVHRFKTRLFLHGGPKYSPDGRFVYFCSRDGWITKYDIYNLTQVAEIRAGINSRNIAVSADGKVVMVANYLPHTLVALSAEDLHPLKVIPTVGKDGTSSRVSAVYTAPPRHSFVAALKDIKEVWEIPYGGVDDSGDKLHHAAASPAFPVRRIHTDDYVDDFFFDQGYTRLFGASRTAGHGQVIDLNSGRKLANLDLPGFPHLGSGITWNWHGRRVMATPNLKQGEVTVIDMQTYKVVKRIKTLGPGFFMRSHPNSRYAWVDVFFGKNRDAMHVIDKQSLKIVKTLRPAPGKTSAHVEFTRDGKYALVSIWDMDGAIVVYNADTLKEVTRIPMKKPSGKYNVYNKTHYESGTSH